MKRLITLGFIFFSLLIYVLYISQFNIYIADEKLERDRKGQFYDYKGAYHVHTNRGDGRYSTREILISANNVGLDFVIFSDINNFDGQFGFEGYYRNTLGIQARQYSYLDSRVILLENESQEHFDSLDKAQLFLTNKLTDSSKDQSIFTVLAHPNKVGYQWDKPLWEGLHGLEIINFKSIWQNTWTNSKLSFLYSILIYPFNSDLALLRIYSDPKRNISLWEKNTKRDKPVTGILANHATAKTRNLIGVNFEFPSYEQSFAIGSNHLLLESELTGDKDRDRGKIFSALQSGQFYFSLDIIDDPKGFEAYMKDNNAIYPLGSEISYSKDLKLFVNIPHKIRFPFEILVFKDGQRIGTYNENSIAFDVGNEGPGAYRVSVRVIPTLPLPDGKQWFTWIYTNHLYVTKDSVE